MTCFPSHILESINVTVTDFWCCMNYVLKQQFMYIRHTNFHSPFCATIIHTRVNQCLKQLLSSQYHYGYNKIFKSNKNEVRFAAVNKEFIASLL